MVSISVRTFINASLHVPYKNDHRTWVEVQMKSGAYRLYLWDDAVEDSIFISTSMSHKTRTPLHPKIIFALYLAALREGLLDPDLPNTNGPPP